MGRMFFKSESSGEVARVGFLAAMRCLVTRLIVDAMRVMSRARYSTSDCARRKGNIIDSIVTIPDGPSVLGIVLYASANSELGFGIGATADGSVHESTEFIAEAGKTDCIQHPQ